MAGLASCLSILATALSSCGGGSTGNERDSGATKTTLTVQATDAENQALKYQWRVTAGSIENRNTAQTVWTLPDGPGLHFAYVVVSDGMGGYASQQYAVSSDGIGNTTVSHAALTALTPPVATDGNGPLMRLRFVSNADSRFTPPGGGTAVRRNVYQPDLRVQLVKKADGTLVYTGRTDLSGETSLPRLEADQAYAVNCAAGDTAPLTNCATLLASGPASVRQVFTPSSSALNLRLYGHVALSDGNLCGHQNDYFDIAATAIVTLQAADGSALSAPARVNRYGDYAIDAAVPVKGALKAKVQCESYSAVLDVPASANPAGYVATAPVQLSHAVPNTRPQILKVVATGNDGNVRGRMIVDEVGASSNSAPGAGQFLNYKGHDTRLSACMYYRAIGAVAGCDAQGNMINPISLNDWKRQHKLSPFNGANTEVGATYVNKMDLNLVRRMVATQASATDIAFSVCNHPGPLGGSQQEVDDVIGNALADKNQIACVVMDWSPTPGANGGLPFTKFLTFGPDGALILSVNLDTRGEKFMPGVCIGCHGGTAYNGRFPDQGNPSPAVGAGFLPFDTGNYYFGSVNGLGEQAQAASIKALNKLVAATEVSATTAVSKLVKAWYASGTDTLDKGYVPDVWKNAEATLPGASRFYREVVGSSCRTCHASLGTSFDWDSILLHPTASGARDSSVHSCGGTADLALNASMPNALISRDRVATRASADPSLAALMTTFLGCSTPKPDPIYPQR